MQPVSRIESARRSLRTTRIAVGAGAAAAFLALTLAVRAAHPAGAQQTSASQSSNIVQRRSDYSFDGGGRDGRGNVGGGGSFGSSPSGSTPQVSSGGS